MFRHFVLIYQKNSNSYQGFSAAVHFIGITLHYWRNFRDIVIIFQMWSTVAGFQELAAGFEPSRNGEIFWINNKWAYLR